MGASLSRSVELQISNNTQNITLRNRGTHIGLGLCSKRPDPVLFPRSGATCIFSGDPVLWGVAGTTGTAGLLLYEATSFTLAIYFLNPVDDKFSMELGLELSPTKAHLDELEATYTRMAKGTYSSSCPDIKFARVAVGQSQESVQVSHGAVRVTATMSSEKMCTVTVMLEEQGGSGEEGGGETCSAGRHVQENSEPLGGSSGPQGQPRKRLDGLRIVQRSAEPRDASGTP